MAGPYNVVVSQTGTGISRAGFGLPVQAAINDLDARVAVFEGDPLRTWAITTSTDGTGTPSGSSTPTRDTVLGTLVIPQLVAGRRYMAAWNGEVSLSAATSTNVKGQIFRVAGSGNPTASDTLIATGGTRVGNSGEAGRESFACTKSFSVPSTGTYAFAMFHWNQTASAVVITPRGDRELIVWDMGPLPA